MSSIHSSDGQSLLTPAVEAALLLGRLDERLTRSSDALRRGWMRRWATIVGVASARLDGFLADPDDAELLLVDSTAGLVDEALRNALAARDLHLAASRRLSRHVWTVEGLTAAARMRLRRGERWRETLTGARRAAEADGVDEYGVSGLFWRLEADPAEMRRSVADALSPERLRALSERDPISGSAGLLAAWRTSGAADLVGAAPGRALADAWLRRQGAVRHAVGGCSEGYRLSGGRAAYRPADSDDGFIAAHFRAVTAAARAGIALHERLEGAIRRVAEAYEGRRSDLLAPRLAAVLLSEPLVSAARAARALKASGEGVRGAISDMTTRGLVVEVTGRDGWRWWRLAR